MITGIDVAIYGILTKLRTPLFDWLWVFFAQYSIYILCIALIVVFIKEKRARQKFFLALESLLLIILTRGLMTQSIYFFFDSRRPFESMGASLFQHDPGNSFPSGHAVAMFSIAAVLYERNKKMGRYAWILAGISALARIVAGVHWASDVVGSLLIVWVGYVILKKCIFGKFGEKKEVEEIEEKTI